MGRGRKENRLPHHLTNLRHGVCNGLPLQTITMDVGPAGHYESDEFSKLKGSAFCFVEIQLSILGIVIILEIEIEIIN